MDRRHFIKLCGTTLLLVRSQARAWASEPAAPLQRYARVALVDGEGRPVRAAKLAKDETYVFFYPYAGTPCYLIRLGTLIESENLTTADGRRYDWTGGVGPGRDVVAYSAICSHLMTHPTRAASFINYHAAADELSGRRNVITCCAHGSVFDPARGAKVIAGPAPQPLAAIALEHDPSSDGLFAIGTFGGEQFREFFKDFKRELRDEFGRGQAKQAVDAKRSSCRSRSIRGSGFTASGRDEREPRGARNERESTYGEHRGDLEFSVITKENMDNTKRSSSVTVVIDSV